MLLTSVYVYVDRRAVPVLMALARKKVEVWATEVINQALMEVLAAEPEYQRLIYLEKDAAGRVIFMQPNLAAINRIKLEVLSRIQPVLGTLESTTFKIPLGELLGSSLFAIRGPLLTVGVIPTGVVEVNVREEFEDAGINQTRHVLYLQAQARLQVVIPLHRELIEVVNELPLVESIIVGTVPHSYFEFRWNQ